MSRDHSPPTGTQAIDRAAELLVRLIECDHAWSTMDLADDARFPRARPRASCGRSSATSSCSATRQRDAAPRLGARPVRPPRRGQPGSRRARAPDPRAARRGQRRDGQPRGTERQRRRDRRPGRHRLHPRRDELGRRQLVLHASALGKVLLAAGVAPVPRPSTRRRRRRSSTMTPCSATSPSCASAATRRASRSSSPVCSPSPQACASARGVIAALAISGPSIRLEARNLDRLGTLLVVEADALSARLGYRQREEGAA